MPIMNNNQYAHIWEKKKIPQNMRALVGRCTAYNEKEILYICKLNLLPNEENKVFLALRKLNLDSPMMNWPYLALTTKASIGGIMMVTPVKVWDFKTGKVFR